MIIIRQAGYHEEYFSTALEASIHLFEYFGWERELDALVNIITSIELNETLYMEDLSLEVYNTEHMRKYDGQYDSRTP